MRAMACAWEIFIIFFKCYFLRQIVNAVADVKLNNKIKYKWNIIKHLNDEKQTSYLESAAAAAAAAAVCYWPFGY